MSDRITNKPSTADVGTKGVELVVLELDSIDVTSAVLAGTLVIDPVDEAVVVEVLVWLLVPVTKYGQNYGRC